MEQGIKFVITGDTKGLDNATKQADRSLDNLSNRIKKLQNDIAANIRISQGYENAIKQLNQEFRDGTITQDQYTKSLDRLQRDERETAVETQNLRKQLSQLQRDQRSLVTANAAGAKSMQNFGRRGGGATATLTSFSQIVQDAPYGIRGMANNIQQATQQFIFLQSSAGSTNKALKSLLATMAGPGGILLAISLVSAALVELEGNQKAVDRITRIMGGGINSLARSQRDFNASLNEGVGSVQGEIAVLQALLGVVRDETENREKRNQAVQILQDKYPQYLSNLTTENSLTQQITDSVNKLTQALENRAKVEAAIDLITERYKTLFEEISKGTKTAQQFSLSKVSEEVRKSRREIEALEAVLPGLQEQFEQTGDVDIQNAITKIRGQISDLREGISEEGRRLLEENIISDFINKETADSREEIQDFINLLQNELGNIPNLFDVFGDPTREAKKDLEALTLGSEPLWRSFESFVKSAQGSVFNLAKSLHDLREQGGTSIQKISASMEGLSRVATPASIEFGESIIRLKEEAKIASDVIGAGFNAMTQQIVNSLETGNAILDALVSAFVGAITQIITASITQSITEKALGKAKIATEQAKSSANAITIATNAAAALGPLGAVALPGILASQLAIINSAFAGIQAFAQGGIVGGGRFTGDNIPIFVNSGERILTQQDQSLLTQFLRGGYANTTNRMGDMGPIRIEGEIRGDNIRLSNERAIRRNRRFGSGING